MDRQEPLMDVKTAGTPLVLQQRVALNWQDVQALAMREASAPVQPSTPSVRAYPSTSIDRDALIAAILPRIEATVREAVSEALEVAIHNATTRMRVDMDRALAPYIAQAIQQELSHIELEKIVKTTSPSA